MARKRKKPEPPPDPAVPDPWPRFTAAEIRGIREARGLSLQEAASRVGITWRAFLAWERGERVPSRPLFRLLEFLRDRKI